MHGLNLLYLLFILLLAYLPYKGRITPKTPLNKIILLSFWFLFCSYWLLISYKSALNVSLNSNLLTIFVVTSCIWFLSIILIRKFGTFPHNYANDEKNKTRFLVRFEYPTMTLKFFEILFQQSTFLFLIFVVLLGLTIEAKIFLFTLTIAIIHLGNLFFMEHKWALFYTVLSIPMAILFGILILKGLVLITTSIHLLFYLIFNARYWFGGDLNKQNN